MDVRDGLDGIGTLRVATSVTPEYRTMDSAPWGAKCILLTKGGVAVIGVAIRPLKKDRGENGYVAWAPLPKIPPEIKELLR